MKFTDLAIRVPQHVIVAADPKVGKSTITGKLAEAGFKLIWFSLDGGHSVLQKLSPKAQANIEIFVFPDTKDYPVAIKSMQKILKGGEHKICDSHGEINCSICIKQERSFSLINLDKIVADKENNYIIVIDQISQLADSADNYVRKASKLGDDEKFEYAHFAHWMNIMKGVMSAIQVAPYNIVCLAHLVESEMEDGKKKLVPMVGSSVFSRKVGGYFDHCIYMEIVNRAHKAGSATTYSGTALSGSRTDVAIENMKEMSLVPFFDGTIKKVEDTKAKEELVSLKIPSKVVEEVKKREGLYEGLVEQPQAGAVTSMHSPVAPVSAPATQENSAMSALERLRNKGK